MRLYKFSLFAGMTMYNFCLGQTNSNDAEISHIDYNESNSIKYQPIHVEYNVGISPKPDDIIDKSHSRSNKNKTSPKYLDILKRKAAVQREKRKRLKEYLSDSSNNDTIKEFVRQQDELSKMRSVLRARESTRKRKERFENGNPTQQDIDAVAKKKVRDKIWHQKKREKVKMEQSKR